MRTNFHLIAYQQLLKQALAAYNKDTSKRKELKRAFARAKIAGCTESTLYKHVHDLFEAMEAVAKEFNVGTSHAEAVSYKMWDLGGQEVCFRNNSLAYAAIILTYECYVHIVLSSSAIPNILILNSCYNPNQIFRAMHKIYSSAGKMSVYPLVFNLEWLLELHEDADDDKRGEHRSLVALDFWLNSIGRYSCGAPVLLIGTHKDVVVGGTDLAKSNIDLAMSNADIKRAHEILGNYIKNMKVYKSKLLNLHVPDQPGLFCKL